MNGDTARHHARSLGTHLAGLLAALVGRPAPLPPNGATASYLTVNDVADTAGPLGGQVAPVYDPLQVFLVPTALAINKARQDHLASLGLDLSSKRVLEVGAGIGLHTPFFLKRGCTVLVTDASSENIAEARRRLPNVDVRQIDLDGEDDLGHLGGFDLIYCYGLLYHLKNPESALRRLSQICRGQLLLETCVALGKYDEVVLLRDYSGNNQAVSGIGCRPTRLWVMTRLRRFFGHAYVTRTQPDHPDFPTDWDLPPTQLIYRSVFVGSKVPLGCDQLLAELVQQQATSARA
jgi:SAM-dependent methyltransferase